MPHVLRFTSKVESFPVGNAPEGGDYVYRYLEVNEDVVTYLKRNNLLPCFLDVYRERERYTDKNFIVFCLDASADMVLRAYFHREKKETLKKLSDKDKELHTARAAQQSAEARVAELEADLSAALRSLQMLRELPEVQAGSGS